MVFLFRFIPGVYQDDPKSFDWTTYLVDRTFNVYDQVLFEGIGRNVFEEFKSSKIYSLKAVRVIHKIKKVYFHATLLGQGGV